MVDDLVGSYYFETFPIRCQAWYDTCNADHETNILPDLKNAFLSEIFLPLCEYIRSTKSSSVESSAEWISCCD